MVEIDVVAYYWHKKKRRAGAKSFIAGRCRYRINEK